jgi:hypothetical protein
VTLDWCPGKVLLRRQHLCCDLDNKQDAALEKLEVECSRQGNGNACAIGGSKLSMLK